MGVNNQIHVSQAVPMSSPLTWKLTGDIESNQFEVRQNAGDDNSPLTCSPECPQEEYVYDYQYAGSAEAEEHSTSDKNFVQEYDFEDSNDSINEIPEYTATSYEETETKYEEIANSYEETETSYEDYDSSDNAIYDSDHSCSDDDFPQ